MTDAELIESVADKRVLFLGERIIDVYHYTRPLGRPTKDAIVSVLWQETEEFEGGVYAAACHAKAVCRASHETRGDVLRKERWVEQSHMRKLFEMCTRTPWFHDTSHDLQHYDAVAVLDYGHGMTEELGFFDVLDSARYLAVNVQTNSENYGFNLATKYQHADYLCVDEPEARLATQNRTGPIEDSLEQLGDVADKVVITLGKSGAVGRSSSDGGIVRQDAFTGTVVDTIGAGDAFFAVTAPLAQHADMATILRIGCAAAAIKVGIIGHQRSVTKDELIGFLEHLPRQADACVNQGRAGRRRARA